MSTPLSSIDKPGWVTLACLQEDVETARRKIEDLEAALVHARTIGTAVGVLMTRVDISDTEAYELLSERSHDEGRPVWQVAGDVLEFS